LSANPPLGTLYLLPTGLGGCAVSEVLTEHALAVARRLACFVAEDPKSARAFLKQAGYPRPLNEASITTLDKDTPVQSIPGMLAPLLQGHDVGLVSEAGCPAIADPGALLVRAAHDAAITVMPMVGPSSILLALMASGLNGQRFAFHGYLPVGSAARAERLRNLERRSRLDDATQIFIETPYRNDTMLRALLEHCAPDTFLCVATDLTQPTAQVRTRRIRDWRAGVSSINRRPSVFLIYAGT